MISVDLKALWLISAFGKPQREINIFALLHGIAASGKLTQAARDADISYRHAWQLLDQWGEYFDSPLVEKRQGHGITLTPLGEALLWAEMRVNARLTAQFNNLASEMQVEINRAIHDTKQIVRLHASHGYAVAEFRDLVHGSTNIQLDLQYRGSVDALNGLTRGDCDIAGFHIPEGALEKEALLRYEKWMNTDEHRLIHFVRRTQGLILAKGNPLQITGIGDLVKTDVRFVNREANSGTRLLFDMMLHQADIVPAAIHGYRREELTHNAVGALIASGMADAGLGVEAAAREFGLDFIPLAAEQYYLICHKDTLQRPAMQSLLQLLSGDALKRAIIAIPGYSAPRSGEVEESRAVYLRGIS
jgi:molybdate transport repressor ModE-like protein